MNFRKLSIIILFSIILISCSTPIQNKWYVMTYIPDEKSSIQDVNPYKIQLVPLDIQKIYDRYNIVYRYSPYEINYFASSKWAVKPNEMITDLLEKHLIASKISETVRRDYFDVKPDYVITGNIEKIEKLISNDLYYAHVAMNLNLIDYSNYQTVKQFKIDVRKEVYQEENSFFVEALSNILSEQFSLFIKDIDKYFKENRGKNVK